MSQTLRLAYRKLMLSLDKPVWTSHPETLQIDVNNNCNLSCTYCNVKANSGFNLPRGCMSRETYRKILQSIGRTLKLSNIAPFMNGEPLIDERLTEFIELNKQITGAPSVIDTNGTLTKNREMLINPNLKLVRFTISAATSLTYLKVHRKDLFWEAVNNFIWFMANKHEAQEGWLNFITTKDNMNEIEDYKNMFQIYNKTIYPLHRGIGKSSSEASLPYNGPSHTRTLLADGREIERSKYRSQYPCPCWAIMGISWDGKIMQCVDFPYNYNYGNVQDIDLMEAWRLRNLIGVHNPCCQSCSIRYPHADTVLNKYVIRP